MQRWVEKKRYTSGFVPTHLFPVQYILEQDLGPLCYPRAHAHDTYNNSKSKVQIFVIKNNIKFTEKLFTSLIIKFKFYLIQSRHIEAILVAALATTPIPTLLADCEDDCE